MAPSGGSHGRGECIEEASEQRISSPSESQACSVLAIAIGLQSLVEALDYRRRRAVSIRQAALRVGARAWRGRLQRLSPIPAYAASAARGVHSNRRYRALLAWARDRPRQVRAAGHLKGVSVSPDQRRQGALTY